MKIKPAFLLLRRGDELDIFAPQRGWLKIATVRDGRMVPPAKIPRFARLRW
jgi:hypothetical protein